MRYCNDCKKQLTDVYKFCPDCGKPTVMIESNMEQSADTLINDQNGMDSSYVPRPQRNNPLAPNGESTQQNSGVKKKTLIIGSAVFAVVVLVSVLAAMLSSPGGNGLLLDAFNTDMTSADVQDMFGDSHYVSGWDEGYDYAYMGLDGELKIGYESGTVETVCWVSDFKAQDDGDAFIEKSMEIIDIYAEKYGEPEQVTSDGVELYVWDAEIVKYSDILIMFDPDPSYPQLLVSASYE